MVISAYFRPHFDGLIQPLISVGIISSSDHLFSVDFTPILFPVGARYERGLGLKWPSYLLIAEGVCHVVASTKLNAYTAYSRVCLLARLVTCSGSALGHVER